MTPSISIVGHAIISVNGMIADMHGSIPDPLIVDADQQNFQGALAASALVVLGRKGHQKHPSRGRRRLVVTRSVGGLSTDSQQPNIHFWNPEGISLASVLTELGINNGKIAITGGQGVFDLFAPIFTAFALAEVHDYVLPMGLPCFSTGHPRNVLSQAGLEPAQQRNLCTSGRVTLTTWQCLQP